MDDSGGLGGYCTSKSEINTNYVAIHVACAKVKSKFVVFCLCAVACAEYKKEKKSYKMSGVHITVVCFQYNVKRDDITSPTNFFFGPIGPIYHRTTRHVILHREALCVTFTFLFSVTYFVLQQC